MDTNKHEQQIEKSNTESKTNMQKKLYKKPESKTHEPLKVISKWRDQSSQLPGI